MIGKKFNRLTILSFRGLQGLSKHAYYECLCDCGNKIVARGSHIRSGNTKSCKCLAGEHGRRFLLEYANSDLHKREGNPSWKGDKAKYSSFHIYLQRNYKKVFCVHCKSVKNLDFALITDKNYSHNIEDYLVLCRSCHMKYDNESGVRKNKDTLVVKGKDEDCHKAVMAGEDFYEKVLEQQNETII